MSGNESTYIEAIQTAFAHAGKAEDALRTGDSVNCERHVGLARMWAQVAQALKP